MAAGDGTQLSVPKSYVRQVERQLAQVLQDHPSRETLAVRLAVAQVSEQAADEYICALKISLADTRGIMLRVMKEHDRSGDQLHLARLENIQARTEAAIARHEAAMLRPYAMLAERSNPRGSGRAPMYRLVEKVMTKNLVEAPARHLWELCKKSPHASRMGISFSDTDAWIRGRNRGNVSFKSFANTVSQVRKARRKAT